ncbi:MAG: superoxide dismutase [Nanoarchaeota archaeon]|nr:superoxide dismutase [Nanoarchaeota archaeon]
MTHELKPLPYPYDSLEPYIDKETMEIHHDKHHRTYVNKLNNALEKNPELFEKKVEELLWDLNSIPEGIRQAVINHGGGTYNHNFFWSILKKDVNPEGEIFEEIKKVFGSFEEFKKSFSDAATTLFGSGWAWLVLKDGKLEIMQTKNQNSPISNGAVPLIAIDVWEHAYYLKYQNKRPEYIENFFNVINWEKVNELFMSSKE